MNVNEKYDHLSYLRKPNTGMLELAVKKWEVDLSKSFFYTDSYDDYPLLELVGKPIATNLQSRLHLPTYHGEMVILIRNSLRPGDA